MAYTIKTTFKTGTQVFDTFNELTSFTSSLTALNAVKELNALVKLNGNVLNEYSDQSAEGWWTAYKVYSDKDTYDAAFNAVFSIAENAALAADAKQATELLGWTVTTEKIVS